MHEVISAVQDGPERQHQVFGWTVRSLKWILPSFLENTKDLANVKNILTWEGGWTSVKEVMGWTLYMEAGTVTLPERKFRELLAILAILTTQRRIGQKDIELLVGNL